MSDSAEGITSQRRVDDYREDTAVRRALEAAAKAVEAMAGTRHYQYAFRKAAKKIRSLKPD